MSSSAFRKRNHNQNNCVYGGTGRDRARREPLALVAKFAGLAPTQLDRKPVASQFEHGLRLGPMIQACGLVNYGVRSGCAGISLRLAKRRRSALSSSPDIPQLPSDQQPIDISQLKGQSLRRELLLRNIRTEWPSPIVPLNFCK